MSDLIRRLWLRYADWRTSRRMKEAIRLLSAARDHHAIARDLADEGRRIIATLPANCRPRA